MSLLYVPYVCTMYVPYVKNLYIHLNLIKLRAKSVFHLFSIKCNQVEDVIHVYIPFIDTHEYILHATIFLFLFA